MEKYRDQRKSSWKCIKSVSIENSKEELYRHTFLRVITKCKIQCYVMLLMLAGYVMYKRYIVVLWYLVLLKWDVYQRRLKIRMQLRILCYIICIFDIGFKILRLCTIA